VSTFDALRELPLRIDDVTTDVLSLALSPELMRRTTIVRLRGAGEEGVGEDVVYDASEHDWFPILPTGEFTLASFSQAVGGLPLFRGAAEHGAFVDYRRWAIESAALDLALRQAGTTLGEALGREARPLRFVVSTRAELDRVLELYPSTRFKLDPTPEWTDDFVRALAARGIVDVVDLKGAYKGTPVDLAPEPELYRRVAEGFPRAWIEDPALTPETDEVLRPHRDRITWDAPIHSWADVEALPFAPRCLNCKPSRFGTLERLFEFYDRCAERGIELYGGGQLELGPGRGQIQLLASLFHPDAPNDVAPAAFNEPTLRRGLPTSPLALDVGAGFRAEAVAAPSSV
jgi:L-alanine-DL-glutamate epimerase-like enolase superfamily enzyme